MQRSLLRFVAAHRTLLLRNNGQQQQQFTTTALLSQRQPPPATTTTTSSRWTRQEQSIADALRVHRFPDDSIERVIAGGQQTIQAIDAEHVVSVLQQYRQIGVPEEGLIALVEQMPHALAADMNFVANRYGHLFEWFPKKELLALLATCPHVLLEQWEHVHKRVLYASFMMGLEQDEMVKCDLLRYSFEHIKARHMILQQLGMWKNPERKKNFLGSVRDMKKIISFPDERFADEYVGIALEDYEMWKKLWREEIENDDDVVDLFAHEYERSSLSSQYMYSTPRRRDDDDDE